LAMTAMGALSANYVDPASRRCDPPDAASRRAIISSPARRMGIVSRAPMKSLTIS
jgi:hypothetical protein